MEGRTSVSHLIREILSAISLDFVSMRPGVRPTGLSIMRAHWMRPEARPIELRLQALMIHDSAVLLSAYRSDVGYGTALSSLQRRK